MQFPGKPRNSADIDVVDLKEVDFSEGVAKKSMNPHTQLPCSEQGSISPQAQEILKSRLDSQRNEKNKTTEDNPNKLWCICQKTHNNRFMIGCDTCQGNSLRGIVNWSAVARSVG